MKKLIFLGLLNLWIASALLAQKINVPANVSKAFSSQFPTATDIKWGKESANEYEAEFKINNVPVSANFKTNGSWTETEETINVKELPAAVNQSINSKYPGAVISLCERIEKPGDKIFYEVNIHVKGKKKELEMNPDGTIVK